MNQTLAIFLFAFLVAFNVVSCTITHHWQTYEGRPRAMEEIAVLKPSLRGFKINSINGWTRPGPSAGMSWDEAYDLLPGRYIINGAWESSTVMPVGNVYHMEFFSHPGNLELNAKAGRCYKIVGGENLLLPGHSPPRIIEVSVRKK